VSVHPSSGEPSLARNTPRLAATGAYDRGRDSRTGSHAISSPSSDAQRTTLYEIVRVGEGPEALAHLGDDVPLFVESLRELPAEYPDHIEGEEGGAAPAQARAATPTDSLIMPS